jgi:hypothetical protein
VFDLRGIIVLKSDIHQGKSVDYRASRRISKGTYFFKAYQ